MKRYTPAVAVAVALLLLLAGIAIAQTGAVPGLTQSVLVTVSQVIPADITLAIPQDDGAVLTVTAPITVGVNLQITLDGAHVVAVEVGETEPPAVAVEELAPTASNDPWASIPTITATPAQEQSTGGIVMAVQGIAILDASASANAGIPDIDALLGADAFSGATAIGFARVSVTNTTDSKLRYSPIDGVIVIGDEQIDLADFHYQSDDFGSEIYPGVNKRGFVFFALKNTPWDKIANGAAGFWDAGQPSDLEYNRKGDAPMTYTFELMPR